jgi:hypothetical protein
VNPSCDILDASFTLKQYLALAKIIVYSNSIKTIKELGSKEALNCYIYFANVGSTKEKD